MSVSRLGAAALVISCAALGCNDPAECTSAATVGFDPPALSSDAPTPQADIRVHSSLKAGDMVDLEVDANDGAQLTTMSAPVDASGNVMFANVPVSAPGVMLHATGQGVCGIGRDALAFAVTGASAGSGSGSGSGSGGGSGSGSGSGSGAVDTGPCVLTLVPAPEPNAFYAQTGLAGVLTTRTDPDPTTPGYQTTTHVNTAPGWTAVPAASPRKRRP